MPPQTTQTTAFPPSSMFCLHTCSIHAAVVATKRDIDQTSRALDKSHAAVAGGRSVRGEHARRGVRGVRRRYACRRHPPRGRPDHTHVPECAVRGRAGSLPAPVRARLPGQHPGARAGLPPQNCQLLPSEPRGLQINIDNQPIHAVFYFVASCFGCWLSTPGSHTCTAHRVCKRRRCLVACVIRRLSCNRRVELAGLPSTGSARLSTCRAHTMWEQNKQSPVQC